MMHRKRAPYFRFPGRAYLGPPTLELPPGRVPGLPWAKVPLETRLPVPAISTASRFHSPVKSFSAYVRSLTAAG